MTGMHSRWQPQPLIGDAQLRRWLLDRGSLTRRIQMRCQNFRLDVLSQGFARACRDEYAVIEEHRGTVVSA